MFPSPSVENTNATILIVDDQELNRKVVGTVLSMTGHEVLTAGSGEEAVQLLSTTVPDLILLDVLMPDMDGLELCRKIKEQPVLEGIPVIFLSAADDKNLIVQALETGGVDYVTKPFNKAELLSRVRTHLALKQARDQLKQLAEDKDELLGIMAHDLQNHLAGMRMSAGLLQGMETELPAKHATLVNNILQSSEGMLGFVKGFLANQSAERMQPNRERVDISLALQMVAAQHEAFAAAKNIGLKFELAAGPAIADADREALAMVLDNLISNALKFSPYNSTVTLRVKPNEHLWVALEVEDQGPGFTADDRVRMFKRYARLSAKPTGGEPSTGLGLSIVKKLVESMKGQVILETVAPQGARFTVKLPPAGPAMEIDQTDSDLPANT